jgi:hypothetical protein
MNLLESCTVERKVPKLGILIDIESVFVHDSKAFSDPPVGPFAIQRYARRHGLY